MSALVQAKASLGKDPNQLASRSAVCHGKCAFQSQPPLVGTVHMIRSFELHHWLECWTRGALPQSLEADLSLSPRPAHDLLRFKKTSKQICLWFAPRLFIEHALLRSLRSVIQIGCS